MLGWSGVKDTSGYMDSFILGFRNALLAEWAEISADTFQKLVESLPRCSILIPMNLEWDVNFEDLLQML